ncbi:MAG: AMP-binding protein [Cyanobacteria bacterium J06635_10]
MKVEQKANFLTYLRKHTRDQINDTALRFLYRGEPSDSKEWTYGELERRIATIAAYLRDRKAVGKAVLLAYSPGLEFVAALLGCFSAGAIAVPSHSPTAGKKRTERFLAISADCGAKLVLTDSKNIGQVLEKRATEPKDSWYELDWINTENLPEIKSDAEFVIRSSIAFIQYTSGSTGKPRGVMVSHENLQNNLEHIFENIFTVMEIII